MSTKYINGIEFSSTLGKGDTVYVNSGGGIFNTVMNSGGAAHLLSAGYAENSIINSNGALHVSSGAYARKTTVNRSGYLGVGLGALTSNTTIGYAGELTVWGGGNIVDNVINSWGAIILSSGAAASKSIVNSDGGLHVYSGAKAYETTVNQSGFLGIGLGATAYDTTIGYAGEVTVWGGGKVIDNTINTWGAIILSSGAAASNTIINSDGGLHVYSGASACETTVNQGGFLGVGLGATASKTAIGYAGALTVWGGGYIDESQIGTWGAIILSSGAAANNTQIKANGGLHVYKGASAYSTEVNKGASLGVGSGGMVHGVEVYEDASLTIYNGALVSGTVEIAGKVYAKGNIDTKNAYFILEVSSKNKQTEVMLDSLSALSTPNLYVRVNEPGQRSGSYALAGNASSFNGQIGIYGNLGGSDRFLGNLTVNGPALRNGNADYSLSIANGILYLNVSYAGNPGSAVLHTNNIVTETAVNLSNKTLNSANILIATGGAEICNTVLNGGTIAASNGTLVSSAVMNSGLITAEGAYVENLRMGGGYLAISSGSIADCIEMTGGGLLVQDDATAQNNNISGGTVNVTDDGTVVNTVIHSGVFMEVTEGGESYKTAVMNGGTVVAKDGGDLLHTSVYSGGIVTISDGGTGERIDLYTGAELYIKGDRTTVSGIECKDSGVRLVMELRPETDIQYMSAGRSYEIVNGKFTNGVIDTNTYVEVYSGGMARDLYITGYIEPRNSGSAGVVQLHSGGTGCNLSNHTSGQINVSNGGYLESSYVDTDGEIYIENGGMAKNLTAVSTGYIWIHSGGSASSVDLKEVGLLTVSSGGFVEELTVSAGGHAIVEENNAYAKNVQIYQGGTVEICGGNVQDVVVHNGGLLVFNDQFTVMGGITTLPCSNGQASNVTLMAGGQMALGKTDSATDVVLMGSGASVQVTSASRLTNLTMGEDSYAIVNNGGLLVGGLLHSGALLDARAGSVLTGTFNLLEGNIIAQNGANIVLDLTQSVSAYEPLIKGWENMYGGQITVSVSDSMSGGTYALASTYSGEQEYYDFMYLAIDGNFAGTLNWNQPLSYGSRTYTLVEDGNTAYLHIADGAVYSNERLIADDALAEAMGAVDQFAAPLTDVMELWQDDRNLFANSLIASI